MTRDITSKLGKCDVTPRILKDKSTGTQCRKEEKRKRRICG